MHTNTPRKNGDNLFRGITLLFAFSIIVILLVMAAEMVSESLPSLRKFGWGFVTVLLVINVVSCMPALKAR